MVMRYVRHSSLREGRWTKVHVIGSELIPYGAFETLPIRIEQCQVFAEHIPLQGNENNSYFWKEADNGRRILYRLLGVQLNEFADEIRTRFLRVSDGYVTNPSIGALVRYQPAIRPEVDQWISEHDVRWMEEHTEQRRRNAHSSMIRAEADLMFLRGTMELTQRVSNVTSPEEEEDVIPVPEPAPAPAGLERGSVASNFTEPWEW